MEALWQPSCELAQLRDRAQLLAKIRDFFHQRAVLEVETPILGQAVGTDPHLNFFTTQLDIPPNQQILYLQTSPEFAMKRLLAAGSGSIFQICKAFRNGEHGRWHNPEFTLLEWYRVDFSLDDLMNEVAELLISVLPREHMSKSVRKYAYKELFLQHTSLDPTVFERQQYIEYAYTQNLVEAIALCNDDHNLWLDFIFSHKIQPRLGNDHICFVHSYPAEQAALARLKTGDSSLAERFEIFINGIELGNGFFELADAREQECRFDYEINLRKRQRLPEVSKDRRLLAALTAGLPDCSGVAIGLDRLLLVAGGLDGIDQAMAFPIDRA